MSLLRGNGYITKDNDSLIELTEAGMRVAQRNYERIPADRLAHHTSDSPEVAAQDACKST
jgi:Mn-dependent DtxR family transcriptional regulator